jgi:hypothetical protein
MVEATLNLNYGNISNSQGGADPAEVWATLRQILHRDFAIPLDQIKPNSRFVEDFGLQ